MAYYKRGKRSVIARKRSTKTGRRVRSLLTGTYKRRAKRAVKRGIIKRGLRWGILGI